MWPGENLEDGIFLQFSDLKSGDYPKPAGLKGLKFCIQIPIKNSAVYWEAQFIAP